MKTVANFDRIGEENAFAVLARATALAAQGRDIINLGIGQPDFRTPDHIVEAAAKALNLPVRAITIGPRADYEDHVGDWHKVRDIKDGGCLLVRPDQHVAWRSQTASATATADLTRTLRAILGH